MLHNYFPFWHFKGFSINHSMLWPVFSKMFSLDVLPLVFFFDKQNYKKKIKKKSQKGKTDRENFFLSRNM